MHSWTSVLRKSKNLAKRQQQEAPKKFFKKADWRQLGNVENSLQITITTNFLGACNPNIYSNFLQKASEQIAHP